jgi:hypothetical protein
MEGFALELSVFENGSPFNPTTDDVVNRSGRIDAGFPRHCNYCTLDFELMSLIFSRRQISIKIKW